MVDKTLKQLIMTTLKTLLLKRKTLVLFTSCLMLFSCSGDDNSSDDDSSISPPTIDRSEISGEYSGEASAAGGRSEISMRIRPRSTEGQYSVEFFAFGNLTSCCNSNGRPEAIGTLQVVQGELTFDLNWNTDTPVCSGNYTGTNGTFQNGIIDIDMDFELSCTEDGSESWKLEKIADL
ncbi:MAG: hypothetical protein Tsb004_17640 [Allomuricauda sp.]